MGIRTLSPVKEFKQEVALDTWTINHNLGYNPLVFTRIMHEGVLQGIHPKAIEHPTVNQVVIRWSVPRAGEVTLS